MSESLKNDEKSIRSYILNDVLENVPINKSYKNLCKVIGNDAIAFYDFQYWYYRFLSGKQDLEFDRSSEPEPLQFSHLPVDAVGLILDKLEVVERLVLRKVSKPLRNLVEKQGIDCTSINFSCGNNLIDVSYGSGQILYAKNEEAVKSYQRLVYVRDPLYIYGEHYESEAFNELAWILKKPKLQIEYFDLSQMLPCSKDAVTLKCFNTIKLILKSVKHQISVKKLFLRPEHPDDILAILPYIKPGYLEKITISAKMASFDWGSDENSRKVEQIMQLDQWKKAKQLELPCALHLFPDEVLLQFKRYTIVTRMLNQDQLDRIKMKFAASPVFERCYFAIKEQSRDANFLHFIGVPGPLTEGYRCVRHYMILNTDKFLVFKQRNFYEVIEIEKKTQE